MSRSLHQSLRFKRRVALRVTRGGIVRFGGGRYSQSGWWKTIPQRPYRWLRRKGLIDVDDREHVFVTELGKTYL